MRIVDIIGDVTISLVTRVVVIATGLISSIITARVLGVTGRGEYFYIITLASLATQLANLGLVSSNTYALAKDHSLLPRLAANSFWISLVVGAFAACCIVIFEADQTKQYWFDGPVLLLILMVPTMLYGLLASNLFIGMSLIRQYNIFQLFSNMFQLVLVTGAAWMALGVGGFLMVSAFTGLVAGGLLAAMLGRLHKLTLQFDWRLLHANLGYAGRAYMATLLGFGVNRVGVLLLGHYSGKAEIGIYSVAVQFADVLIVVPSTVAMVLFPNLLKDQIDERFQSTMRTTAQVALIMGALCVLTGFVAIWIVPTLFGVTFGSAVQVLWWMLPGVFALSLASIISQYLAARGIPLANVWSWLGGLVFLLAISSQMIPRWGASGTAASLSLTYILLAVALIIIAIRQSTMETQSGTQ
jgi:O-antigen/teichoic acid export membrane protein